MDQESNNEPVQASSGVKRGTRARLIVGTLVLVLVVLFIMAMTSSSSATATIPTPAPASTPASTPAPVSTPASTPDPTPAPKEQPPVQPPAVSESGVAKLLAHKATGKCLDSNGNSLYFMYCQPNVNDYQKWVIEGGFIKHPKTSKCIAMRDGKYTIEACKDGDSAQQWTYENNLLKHSSGVCMDANGSSIYNGQCNTENPYQTWFSETHPLAFSSVRHKASGKCLDLNGNNVQFAECQNGNQWRNWKYTGGRIVNAGNNAKCIAFDGKSVNVADCKLEQDGDENQKWTYDNGLLKHQRGSCLDGNGNSLYMGECKNDNPYMNWNV